MPLFLQFLVLFILTTIPILFAAVQPFVWAVYTVLMYAAFTVMLWIAPQGGMPRPGKAFYLSLAPFFLATLLLCVPLPDGLLALLSPTRFQLLQDTQSLTGQPAHWRSLGYYPLHGLAWWGFLLGLALLFPVLQAHFRHERSMRLTLWLLFGLAVLQACYGLFQALMPNTPVLWASHVKAYLGMARGTWINRNHFAGYLEMMILLLLGFLLARIDWRGEIKLKTLLHSDRIHQHGLFLLGLVLMALALLFSQSRAGITGLFVGLATFLALLGAGGRRVPATAWLAVGALACLVIFYGGRIGFDPVLERFLALSPEASRLDFWRDSLAMLADHPLGIGLAAFKPLFPLYHTTSLPGGNIPYYLHNDVLQLFTDAGWIGALALLGGLVWFMLQSVRKVRRMNPAAAPGRFFPAVGALSGMTALIFHSFFDFNLQMPANALYFVMLMAIVDSSMAVDESD
jgi:O-Antigen ligase